MHTYDQREKLLRLRAFGMSFRRIARELNIGRTTLARWARHLSDDLARSEWTNWVGLRREITQWRQRTAKRLIVACDKLGEEVASRSLDQYTPEGAKIYQLWLRSIDRMNALTRNWDLEENLKRSETGVVMDPSPRETRIVPTTNRFSGMMTEADKLYEFIQDQDICDTAEFMEEDLPPEERGWQEGQAARDRKERRREARQKRARERQIKHTVYVDGPEEYHEEQAATALAEDDVEWEKSEEELEREGLAENAANRAKLKREYEERKAREEAQKNPKWSQNGTVVPRDQGRTPMPGEAPQDETGEEVREPVAVGAGAACSQNEATFEESKTGPETQRGATGKSDRMRPMASPALNGAGLVV